jgi:hypothetical protein
LLTNEHSIFAIPAISEQNPPTAALHAPTKHPHLSIVQLFKEPLTVQRRKRIMQKPPESVNPLQATPTPPSPSSHYALSPTTKQRAAHYKHPKQPVNPSIETKP